MTNSGLIIGLGAGLLSALLFASASTGTTLGLFVLFFLSPLPVAVAGLGWSWRAAVVASIAAVIAIVALGTPRSAAFHALAIGAPTALLSYLLLLNRDVQGPSGDAATEWYPLGRVVAIAAMIAGGLAAVGLLTTANDIDSLKELMRGMLERMLLRAPGAPVPPGMPAEAVTSEQIAALTNVLIGLFTASLASMWFGVAMINLWLAGLVVRRSERLVRPWPQLSELRLPPLMPFLFAVALAGTFLAGFEGLIASGFASAILMAYVLVGLAILHHVTRGHALRATVLTGAYAGLFLFAVLVAPVIALIGLAEPISPLRRRPSNPDPS